MAVTTPTRAGLGRPRQVNSPSGMPRRAHPNARAGSNGRKGPVKTAVHVRPPASVHQPTSQAARMQSTPSHSAASSAGTASSASVTVIPSHSPRVGRRSAGPYTMPNTRAPTRREPTLTTEPRQTSLPTPPATSASTTSRRGAAASGSNGQMRRGHTVQPGSPCRGGGGPSAGGSGGAGGGGGPPPPPGPLGGGGGVWGCPPLSPRGGAGSPPPNPAP